VVDLAHYEGRVWCGLSKNLLRLDDETLAPNLPEDAGQDALMCLAEGGEGELYAGFRSKGLFRRADGAWSSAGLSGPIGAVAVAPDRTIWARRGMGELCWLRDGEWHHADAHEMGIPPQFHMVCSREGSIWFQGLHGPVIRIDRQAAEAWLQGDRKVDLRKRIYGRAEGLPAEQAPYGPRKSTIMEDSQGRIWVATVLGTCAWHPSYDEHTSADITNAEPIPVLIEKVFMDDEPFIPMDGAVTLPPDKRRLEIHYAGLDLAGPDRVSYRYRVVGYQDDWLHVGNRHTAYLQRMPPGRYTFQVIASDRNGVWNKDSANLAIVVQPNWWEYTWLRFFVTLVVVTVLFMVVYLRIMGIRHSAELRAGLQDEFSRGLIQAQESERSRIAGELHDDLGQDLLVLKSRIDLSRRRSDSEAERDVLQGLSESTADVLHKTRSLSHQLRPLHLDHLGLAASVRNLVKEVAEAAELNYEVETNDVEDVLPSDTKVAIYRMLQEALNNTIKHAGAGSVKVELQCHENTITLTIEDDGCGFDSEQAGGYRGQSAAHGLHAMKERCALVGGRMIVDTTPGEGTLLLIEVPTGQPQQT
jgi:signal transduction histidine kinase